MTHARRRIGAAALAASALLVTMAAPAMAGDVSSTSAKSPVGDWRTRTSGVTQTITFTDDGMVFGDAGCNRFTGSYTTDGSSITIGPLATTLMACEQPVMDAEQTFLVRLQAAVSYRAKAETLRIYAPKDLIRFVAN